MQLLTLHGIKALLSADPSVSEAQVKDILRYCRDKSNKNYINAKEACGILGVSRPTLREYVKRGHIQQYNLSSRKVRFDADDIAHFADTGMQSGGPHV